jgi:hypothetical protein
MSWERTSCCPDAPGIDCQSTHCEAIPHGPARTDCYLGLSQFYRGQSDLAAARASAQADAAWYWGIYRSRPPNTKHIGDDKGSDYSHTGREDRLCVGQSKLAA